MSWPLGSWSGRFSACSRVWGNLVPLLGTKIHSLLKPFANFHQNPRASKVSLLVDIVEPWAWQGRTDAPCASILHSSASFRPPSLSTLSFLSISAQHLLSDLIPDCIKPLGLLKIELLSKEIFLTSLPPLCLLKLDQKVIFLVLFLVESLAAVTAVLTIAGLTCLCLFLPSGEEPFSYGYGGTGKKSTNSRFENYGDKFAENDVIGCFAVSASSRWELAESSVGPSRQTCRFFSRKLPLSIVCPYPATATLTIPLCL